MDLTEANNSSKYVLNIARNDVLLGRGAPIINNEGNVRFRQVVEDRKDDYNSTSKHQDKNRIALEILEVIVAREGRFLRKIENEDEAKALGAPLGGSTQPWVIASEAVVLQKIKQCLREQKINAPSKKDTPKSQPIVTGLPHQNHSTLFQYERRLQEQQHLRTPSMMIQQLMHLHGLPSQDFSGSGLFQMEAARNNQRFISQAVPEQVRRENRAPLPQLNSGVQQQLPRFQANDCYSAELALQAQMSRLDGANVYRTLERSRQDNASPHQLLSLLGRMNAEQSSCRKNQEAENQDTRKRLVSLDQSDSAHSSKRLRSF